MANNETKILFEKIRSFNESVRLEEGKEWSKLRKRIFTAKTDEEIVKIVEDVKEFFKSDAPEEDKENLKKYIECLPMMLDSVKN